MFNSEQTEKVLAAYRLRDSEEQKLMKTLGPAGFNRRDEWLLPIGEDVGRFLHSLILAKKPKRILEVGTSYGYSTLFLADAAKQVGAQVITLELADYKQAYAKQQMEQAGLANHVEFKLGDAIEAIKNDTGLFDFVLLDIWKELYVPALEAMTPKLSPEAVIAADNMYHPPIHLDMARQYRQLLSEKDTLYSTLLPIGAGIELTTYWPQGSPKI